MSKKIIKKQAGDRFFYRENFYGEWSPARSEKLKSILSERDKPYSKEKKAKLPQFGYGKIKGETSTQQLFPTHYVVIDLDVPDDYKSSASTDEGFKQWSDFYMKAYHGIVSDQSIPYKVSCLTPSMCGLRFILELENQVADEEEYIQAINQFCALLEKYGIKEEHIDIRVHQPWYLPTFMQYFNERDHIFGNEIIKTEKKTPASIKATRSVNKEEVERLIQQIEEKEVDITNIYLDWVGIGFALVDEFGEEGRQYYHKVSQFYPDYEIQACNKQYDYCLKSDGKGITIRTFFWMAQQNGLLLKNQQLSFTVPGKHCFWVFDRRSKGLKIDMALFYDFLEAEGFAKLYVGDPSAGNTSVYIQKQGYIVRQCTKENIIEYSYSYIKKLSIETPIKNAIRNAFHISGSKVNENNLATLSIADIPFKNDTKDAGYLYFRNVFLEVTKSDIQLHPYDKLDGYIWANEILDREFVFKPFSDIEEESNFYQFLVDICTHGEERADVRRLRSLNTILGYVLHFYKDPANAKAIVLMDKDKTANAEGGTGKSLILESFKHIRSGYVQEDGRRLKSDGRFEWAQVGRDTKIVAVDDLRDNFKLEHLFSMITNDMIVEKKNQDKFTFAFNESPKFIFSTNYAIQGIGRSFERRLIEFELSDYYHKHSSPRRKFGETFFENSWSEQQWQLFDNLMVYAVQQYLQTGIKKPRALNIRYRKSVQATTEEFVDFFKSHIKVGVKYNKHNLHLRFTKLNREYENLSQYKFTTWLNSYASINGFQVEASKSGNQKFVTITKNRKINK